jgi:TonB-dependent receptor
MNCVSPFLSVFHRLRRWLPAGLLVLASGLAAGAAETAKRPFDIPAGPAESTLRRFAEQAGGQFLFSADKVAGVRTNAVKGDFTAREALQQLVAGTELRAVHDERTGALTVDRVATTTATGAAGGTGSIEGRVLNQAIGSYVTNARLVIDALRLETFTDEHGFYVFPRVPAGDAEVKLFYIGYPSQTVSVAVAAGRRAARDFTVGATADAAGSTVVLDAFTVASKRDMAASDIAVNEQRFATGIKNVVSTDSFADIADGNVGEFAKYLPGVTLNRSGSDGLNLSLGGVPPSGTPIMLDGLGIASAASSNTDRVVEFENIAMGGMSRVEVSRSPTPDSPANAIGGSVNLISRSAFERSRPQYSVKTYLSWRGGDFDWGKTPGPFQHKEYPFEPNLELGAVVPVTKNFGFTFSGLLARTKNNGPGAVQDWVPNVSGQSANFPVTTPDNPYLVRFRLQERPKITLRNTASVSADWRVSPADVLTFGFQYSYFTAEFWVRQLNYDVGRVVSFGRDFTQGAAGTGFTQILTDAREKNGTSWAPSIRWKHNGRIWQWQVGGSYSGASNHYSNEGYFLGNNAFYRGLTLRFDRLTADHPGTITVTDAAGRPANVHDLGNYRLETVSGQNYTSAAIVRSVYANAKRELDFRLPLTVKGGVDLRVEHRDFSRPNYSRNFVGSDGVIRTADDSAAQWFDPSYSERTLLFGPRMQWFDNDKIGGTFRSNPDYFPMTETQRVNAYRSTVTTSQAITETILAPYVRLDTKLVGGRVQVTGGVRYEQTRDEGDGPLIDPSLIYRRDAQGRIVRDAQNRPAVIAPLATLAGSQLAYTARASTVDKTYDGFFPSLNASFLVRQNLIARASYGRAINRPNFGNILPSMNLPDPEGTSRTITLTNPNLKPWIADSFGLAIEYYFNEPSGGVLSARAYRRDISDFFGTSLRPATADLLEPYGIDPDTYGEALGYMVSTARNVGRARVSGTEFDYRQNLTFLPQWARGFTVFANMTLQHLEGDASANFSGFVGKTSNWGITYSRQRFTVRLAVNLRGRVKQGQVTAAGSEPGTFIYLMPRRSADVSAEYRVTRKISVYLSGRNVNEAIDDQVRYGPSTPGDRIITNRVHYGPTWYVGLKGTF